MTLGDRTVLMRLGGWSRRATPLDLFERPQTRFVAEFFGWPKMSFLAGVLSRRDGGDAIRLGPTASPAQTAAKPPFEGARGRRVR